MKERKRVYLALVTPDGTKLPTFHQHDCRTYKDDNRKIYMIDGGYSGGYYRKSAHGDEHIMEVFMDEPFEKVREYYYRYNKRTDGYIKLKDMTDEWLESLIAWYLDEFEILCGTKGYDLDYFNLYIMEKQYRNLTLENINEEVCYARK